MSGDESDEMSLVIDEKLTLMACPIRFNGTVNKLNTEEFLSKVLAFKQSNAISDESALKELSCLFQGYALKWWNDVKDAVKNWEDAITLMRYIFAPAKPAHHIYAEIFIDRQEELAPTEEFVQKKRKLFLQLPKPHPEDTQLDMIYFMLKRDIKNEIPRETFSSFDELIAKIRRFEKFPLMPLKKKKIRCGFCRIKGHATEECRKRAKKIAEATEAAMKAKLELIE